MKSLTTFLFLCVFSFTSLTAQQVITGTHRPQARPGFSQYNWKFSYEFYLEKRGEGKGTITWRVVENTMELSGGAVFFDKTGKQYRPSDLSLSSWPNYRSSETMFYGTLQVLYKGSVVKTYSGFNKGATLGTFYAGKDYEWSAMVGSTKILFANFDIADFSMKVVSYENPSNAGTPETNRLINDRAFANRSTSGKATEVQLATSSSNPSSSYSSTTASRSSSTSSTSYSSGTTSTSSSAYEQQRLNQQRDEAIGKLADYSISVGSDIIGDIRDARERKAQRREEQRIADSIKSREESRARYNERQRKLEDIIDQNIDKAKAGDLAARLLIIAATIRYDGSDDITIEHLQWLDDGVKKNDREAILFRAYVTSDWALYKKAANMGSLDAMVLLGEYYNFNINYNNTPLYGNNSDSAFFWFERAAMRGCPRAAYYLGMIYRYGNTAGNLEYYSGDRHSKNNVVTYTIPKDVTKSFEWFGKSIVKDNKLIFEVFKPTPFAEAVNAWSKTFLGPGSFPTSHALKELAYMYRKGIGTKKDKNVAGKVDILYDRYYLKY